MKCILLAAGTSGRILSISGGNPKPLIKIKKKTLIERNILWLKTFGIKDITINLFFKPQLIINEVKKFGKKVQIHFSLEKKLLGTAGAVKKVVPDFGIFGNPEKSTRFGSDFKDFGRFWLITSDRAPDLARGSGSRSRYQNSCSGTLKNHPKTMLIYYNYGFLMN